MRFYSYEQTARLSQNRAAGLADSSWRATHYLQQDPRSRFWMAKVIVHFLMPFNDCLVKISVPIGEPNWHCYYRLRQSYGDFQLLHEAPGHLFLAHETADLITFLEFCLNHRLDADIVTDTNYASASISHDGAIDWVASSESSLADFRKEFPAPV